MVKAAFFDFFQTLVRYEPTAEELQARALRDFGIEVSPDIFLRPMVIADKFMYQELHRSPLSERSEKGKMALRVQRQEILLKEAGLEVSKQVVLGLLEKMQQLQTKLTLFQDVMPALTDLNNRGTILGLISNADRNISPILEQLGLMSLLRVVVTSKDVGYSKPHPEIFHEGLRRAGVHASEAVYIGDQYEIDIVGAINVGMKGLLLDRGGLVEDYPECLKIRSLSQISEHLFV